MGHQLSPLLLIHAHTGKKLCLNIHNGITVNDVKEVIGQSSLKIQKEDQMLLLKDGTKLDDDEKRMGEYDLPNDNESSAPVFIFSRTLKGKNIEMTDDTTVLRVMDKVSTLPSRPSDLDSYLELPPANDRGLATCLTPFLADLSSEAAKSILKLPAYDTRFVEDLNLTKAHWEACIEVLSTAKALISEQVSQGQAIDAARANAESAFKSLSASCSSFLKRFADQHKAHQHLLNSHSSDLEALKLVKVHPDLQNALAKSQEGMFRQGAFNALSLADVLPVSRMKQCHQKCLQNHSRFSERVSELSATMRKLQKEIGDFLSEASLIDLGSLLMSSLPKAERACDDLSLLVQQMSKDRATAKELIERLLHTLSQHQVDPTLVSLANFKDDVEAMGPILRGHFDHLTVTLLSHFSLVYSFFMDSRSSKAKMCEALDVQLSSIAQLQVKMRDVQIHLRALEEVLRSQAEAFNELRMSRGIPSAYRLLLVECMHQSTYVKLLKSLQSSVQNTFDSLVAKERERRTDILNRLALYLPQDLVSLSGLNTGDPETIQANFTESSGTASLLRVSLQDLPSTFYPFLQEASAPKCKSSLDLFRGIDVEEANSQLDLTSFFSRQLLNELSSDGESVRRSFTREIQSCLSTRDNEIQSLQKRLVEQQQRIEELETRAACGGPQGPIALAAGGLSRPNSPFPTSLDVNLQRLSTDSFMIPGYMDLSEDVKR